MTLPGLGGLPHEGFSKGERGHELEGELGL